MKPLLLFVVATFIAVSYAESKDEDIAARISTDIHKHKVVVYSKTYCPYSKKLKKLLSNYAINDLKIVELDKQKEMKAMQAVLKRISGRTTVPQLFIGGEFVGGHDETRRIEDRGNLRKLLEKAHALKDSAKSTP
ncbi:Glutaredoxin CPYC type [Trichostrongylus colubriformis]|uniref:Glutaredoxin CPYC type n=1 Tax=Trichostrongylus colubriformis TaxID=6319 RepID=A0AAN8IUS4_TRICO